MTSYFGKYISGTDKVTIKLGNQHRLDDKQRIHRFNFSVNRIIEAEMDRLLAILNYRTP
jgi:hypothetical protein